MPPLQDQILSFLHTFSLKSAHVRGQNLPKMGPCPPYRKSWIRPCRHWPYWLLTTMSLNCVYQILLGTSFKFKTPFLAQLISCAITNHSSGHDCRRWRQHCRQKLTSSSVPIQSEPLNLSLKSKRFCDEITGVTK